VTIDQAWPGFGSAFTVAELDRMPDDGHRYELLDGALLVSPRPTTVHQVVTGRLYSLLDRVCPEDLCVVIEPAVQLNLRTEFDPDLVVVPFDEVGGAKFTVFELRDGAYVTEAASTQPVTLTRPFPVTVDPTELTRRLRR
jgi:hypothetical protein